jgi:hypothetical protein
VLAEVWALAPDIRLGQLIAHLEFLGEAHVGKRLGYIEDDELIAVLYRHRAEGSVARHAEAGAAAGRDHHIGFRKFYIAGSGPSG